MPEGDSYVHAASSVRPLLDGLTITGLEGIASPVRRHSSRILGATVTGVRTHGKHLFVDLGSGYTIHVHLGMNGAVRVRRGGDGVRAGPAKLSLATERGTVRVDAAPDVDVDRTGQIDRRILGPLGPDLIADEFDWDEFTRRARRADPASSAADFLLDQRIMAGVGNVYKCEVLFAERIHPATPVAVLDERARRSLGERSRVLLRANRAPGPRVTTGDPRRPAWVYARSRKPCRRCGTRIEEDWMGASQKRITYWCPACQPAA